MLSNQEIVVDSRAPAQVLIAVFDLSDAQTAAVHDALTFYQRHRFAPGELDAEGALAMYGVAAVHDQLADLAAAGGHATVRLDAVGLAVAAEAVALYLAERDVESYQSPEERQRIDLLRPMVEPLAELAADLRAAEQRVGTAAS
jgi:hypothetical protein